MQTKHYTVPSILCAASLAVLALAGSLRAADAPPAASTDWKKPNWLTELSLGIKESHDDNVLLVSGNGLQPVSSWVSTFSLRVGVNLVPLLGDQKTLQTFSLSYQPDVVSYDSASDENYTAHRFNTLIKGKSGDVSFSLDNAFLYNDGNKVAPTYALNQLAGASGNQNDKFRNNYAHSVARERRNQIQDRYTAFVQFDSGNYFIRPISTLTFYDLNTDLHNTGAAPYKGYQDYVDRYDVNAGVDLGYKVAPKLALILGYRDGYQYQQKFDVAINADQHHSSSHYQRLLVGLEGKLTDWLTAKVAVGPDFRDYSAAAAMNSLRTTRWYGEAALAATIAPDQSLTLNFKQWIFVASTGLAPYEDVACTLVYHWSATKQWGLDLGAKVLDADYTMGNEITGSAPSLRDDIDYGLSVGVTYAFTPHLIFSATYNYDNGQSNVANLPPSLFASYRTFDHEVVAVGVQYKF